MARRGKAKKRLNTEAINSHVQDDLQRDFDKAMSDAGLYSYFALGELRQAKRRWVRAGVPSLDHPKQKATTENAVCHLQKREAKIGSLEALLQDRESEIMGQDKDLEACKQACLWLVKAGLRERFEWLVSPGLRIIRKFPFVVHIQRELVKEASEDDESGES